MITTKFLQNWRKPIELRGWISEDPSLTIPDDSYTIRDILNQFTSGIQTPMARYDQFDGSDPDFDDQDLLTTFGDLSDYDAARLDQLERVVQAKKEQKRLEEFNAVAGVVRKEVIKQNGHSDRKEVSNQLKGAPPLQSRDVTDLHAAHE